MREKLDLCIVCMIIKMQIKFSWLYYYYNKIFQIEFFNIKIENLRTSHIILNDIIDNFNFIILLILLFNW